MSEGRPGGKNAGHGPGASSARPGPPGWSTRYGSTSCRPRSATACGFQRTHVHHPTAV